MIYFVLFCRQVLDRRGNLFYRILILSCRLGNSLVGALPYFLRCGFVLWPTTRSLVAMIRHPINRNGPGPFPVIDLSCTLSQRTRLVQEIVWCTKLDAGTFHEALHSISLYLHSMEKCVTCIQYTTLYINYKMWNV